MRKQLTLVVVFLVLIPMSGFSQSSNWLSTVNLNISVSSSDRIDLYTDKDGNHIIVQKSDQLIYYLFSATGTQIRTSVRDNNVSEDPRLSKIVGREGKLFIIYKEDDKIKTQKSTDAGTNWSTISELTLNNSQCNGIDAWTDANGIHLVYSEFDGSSTYESWYQRNDGSGSNWVERKQVTDLSGDTGGLPSVTTSANRVHVAFTYLNTGSYYQTGGVKIREKYNGVWQNSESVGISLQAHVITDNNNLHLFFGHLSKINC
ncbi:MAG: hypothetical protein CV087_10145 [Candidatus Brocadia sp. WS118]|nr:MAG: hypothetical protein CV087_10145 [Candidatus Brocadia sp. WS118]